jgi:hypothetical protein
MAQFIPQGAISSAETGFNLFIFCLNILYLILFLFQLQITQGDCAPNHFIVQIFQRFGYRGPLDLGYGCGYRLEC